MDPIRHVNNKDMRAVCKELLREGWTAEMGGKHLKLKTPCGRRCISVSASPSKIHAVNDMKKQILRVRREIAELGPKR